MLPASGCLIFFDTETTGLSDQWDRIIEIAFVLRNYHTMQEQRFYALINPDGKKSGEKAYDAHKIPDADLVNEKKINYYIDDILNFIAEYTLVAHNAQFDRKMLNGELRRLGISEIPPERFECTLKIARDLYTGESNTLDAVCQRLNVDLSIRSECHGAMQDTLILADMYPLLKLNHYYFNNKN